MKTAFHFQPLHLLGLLVLLAATLCPAQAQVQSAKRQPVQAMEGDSVWVVINHVKPDKRDQFERFVYELFWPASAKLDASVRQTFERTRVLNPAAPEADGTYAYVFLMDPLMSGEDYSIERILQRMYPAERAKEYFNLFMDALDREPKIYRMLQSRYWGATTKE